MTEINRGKKCYGEAISLDDRRLNSFLDRTERYFDEILLQNEPCKFSTRSQSFEGQKNKLIGMFCVTDLIKKGDCSCTLCSAGDEIQSGRKINVIVDLL